MKLKKNIYNAIIIILLAALIAGALLLNNRISRLETQIAYTTDNTAVILSDVETMREDIQATLEEEASLIADWNITLKDADFSEMTYHVMVDVIPKEYTETTTASVFFGTNEVRLALDGIKYTGEVVLPMSQDFAGNVTFLFVDGAKRSTEVLDDFEGVISVFRDVVSGVMSDVPSISDGSLKIDTDVDVAILGNDFFTFNKYELVVMVNEAELRSLDIKKLIEKDEEPEQDADTEHAEQVESSEFESKLYGIEGSMQIDEMLPVAAGNDITVFIRATTNQGFVFTYDLFKGTVNQEIDDFELVDEITLGNYTVMDTKDGIYKPK